MKDGRDEEEEAEKVAQCNSEKRNSTAFITKMGKEYRINATKLK